MDRQQTLAEQLLACTHLARALTRTLERERILEMILNRLSELVAAHNWTLYLLDEKTGELRFELVVGLDRAALPRKTLRLGEGIAGTVAKTGRAILVPNAENDPRVQRRIDAATGFVTRSLITLPVQCCHKVMGVLQVVNPEDPSLFEEERLPVLELIADFVAIAMNNAADFERMRTLSLTDDVSGFFNARYLHRRLAELIESGTETSLVFFDLDHFKRIVDAHGHPLAGQVLKEVAQVVARELDPEDSLVRYGGDEYVVLLPRQGKAAAREKVERIRGAVASTSFLRDQGHDVQLTASFGIAGYPEDATGLDALLRNADASLYASKGDGKNRVTVFSG